MYLYRYYSITSKLRTTSSRSWSPPHCATSPRTLTPEMSWAQWVHTCLHYTHSCFMYESSTTSDLRLRSCIQMCTKGVVEVLATLSNSTSEVILELCAKCICNLTSKVDLHPNMIKSKVIRRQVCMYVCMCMFDLKFMYVCLHCLSHNLSPIILLSALPNA